LALQKESNWKRPDIWIKYLLKTSSYWFQLLKSDIMVWNLWSRKEAAYKIYNRATGVRGYFPLKLVCIYENTNSGSCYVMAIPIIQNWNSKG
jgi:hypothetical protein